MRPTPAIACALLGLLGASCSSDDDPEADTTTTMMMEEEGDGGREMAGDHNAADAEFLQFMLVHHEQAVAMSALAADQAESPEVAALAEGIDSTQAAEIDEMRALLSSFGEEELGDMGGMDMSEMDNMEGMLTQEQFATLEAATGAEFDRLFLEGMIAHHEGAVAMADMEMADGQSPEAIALAESIRSGQEDMIPEMEALLDTLG